MCLIGRYRQHIRDVNTRAVCYRYNSGFLASRAAAAPLHTIDVVPPLAHHHVSIIDVLVLCAEQGPSNGAPLVCNASSQQGRASNRVPDCISAQNDAWGYIHPVKEIAVRLLE